MSSAGRGTADREAGAPGGGGGRGRLFVVATPIGNLDDVTLRALEVLRSVPLVAAEDTRLTRRLLDRHGIRARLVSFHARNASRRLPELFAHLEAGADLALVTDAGTPGISDPGEELVAAWSAAGGVVVPIPGPSAVLAAVSATGIAGPRWVFEGFLARRGRERQERLARLAADERGTVLFEAPNRVAATLADLAAACGPDRPAAVCRELTKIHEAIEHGSLGALAERAARGDIPARGEFVIVVGARRSGWASEQPGSGEARGGGDSGSLEEAAETLAEARAAVERLVAEGRPRSAAAREVARRTGLRRRDLYRPDR
ncbi:MAG: ribosomal RNA small subunit methyltransferase I [Chloroflexota bacterium]|nr:MAG: ribosomal RNA small subunit methyltransferase I [Chloroflexota bacterium]